MNRFAVTLYVVALAGAGALAAYSGAGHVLEAAKSTDVYALVALAAVCGVLGLVAARQEAQASTAPVPLPPPVSTPEALDPAATREMVLKVAEAVKPAVEAPNPDVIAILDMLLGSAINLGASDLHFQPLETGTLLSFRVAGVLEEVISLPQSLHAPLVVRVKVLGKLVTYSSKPQDAHFTFAGPAGPVDVRVSLLPTNHGEKIVLRVPRRGASIAGLPSLGFTPALLARYLPLLARPQGLIFICGPTGAGKTTTIYASLAQIKKERGDTTHVSTIEDPVEFDLPFLSQTQVRPGTGLTFAHGLRSMLRQDPNVMMVGEIRDSETAGIAIQAGLSGHLILTTVHAESAAGVFTRMIEIGVEPYALASASVAALSQRLVRALCPHCRKRTDVTPMQRERLVQLGSELGASYEPVGCQRCGKRGYLGRTAVYELLEVTPEVRELINKRVPTPQLAEGAKGARATLAQDALAKVEAGVTSLDEALRLLA
jgi:general secretion pathway protein E